MPTQSQRIYNSVTNGPKFIDGELADNIGLMKSGKKGEDGKKHKKDPKTFLTIENYVHMQERHWYDDFHDYLHEGYRVDNTNLLNNHCFTSARLSEVCQAVYEVSTRVEK